jgi:hypothetical protein
MKTRRRRKTDPTAEEIEWRASQIRAGWSERTLRKRAGKPVDKIGGWTVPEINDLEIERMLERRSAALDWL